MSISQRSFTNSAKKSLLMHKPSSASSVKPVGYLWVGIWAEIRNGCRYGGLFLLPQLTFGASVKPIVLTSLICLLYIPLTMSSVKLTGHQQRHPWRQHGLKREGALLPSCLSPQAKSTCGKLVCNFWHWESTASACVHSNLLVSLITAGSSISTAHFVYMNPRSLPCSWVLGYILPWSMMFSTPFAAGTLDSPAHKIHKGWQERTKQDNTFIVS